jgi:hypothetical protein
MTAAVIATVIVFFCLVLFVPWLALLIAPLALVAGVAIGLPLMAVRRIRRPQPEGILGIDGLASAPGLADGLRADIGRVLAFAPRDSRPRACAGVKEVDGSFVGVLRMFNSKGHYLLRVTGGSVASVTRRFASALDEFTDAFPALVGARRAKCAECNTATCPLRLIFQEGRALAAA